MNDYVYVPGEWMVNGQDIDRPYEDEPKVPIDKAHAAINDPDMDSEIDDGAVENENDNEAVVWRIV